jgi:ketosteroid isomerase-like protein
VEVVKRGLEAWNKGDIDGWMESMHPDIEWTPAIAQRVEGADSVYRGLADQRRFWDEWHAVWEFRLHAAEVRDLGDTVLALGRTSATGRASGVATEASLALVVTLEDGLVRRMRTYPTHADALEALGLSE